MVGERWCGAKRSLVFSSRVDGVDIDLYREACGEITLSVAK